MSQVRTEIEQLVNEHPVVVFSKTYCPHCLNAKATLNSLGVESVVRELDQLPNTSEYQDALEAWTGRRTVPNIFIGGQSYGGNDELQELARSGRLPNLIAEAVRAYQAKGEKEEESNKE